MLLRLFCLEFTAKVGPGEPAGGCGHHSSPPMCLYLCSHHRFLSGELAQSLTPLPSLLLFPSSLPAHSSLYLGSGPALHRGCRHKPAPRGSSSLELSGSPPSVGTLCFLGIMAQHTLPEAPLPCLRCQPLPQPFLPLGVPLTPFCPCCWHSGPLPIEPFYHLCSPAACTAEPTGAFKVRVNQTD